MSDVVDVSRGRDSAAVEFDERAYEPARSGPCIPLLSARWAFAESVRGSLVLGADGRLGGIAADKGRVIVKEAMKRWIVELFERHLTMQNVFGWTLLAVVVSLMLACAISAVSASGEISYCTVEHRVSEEGDPYVVVGHRMWRPDVTVARAPTPDEAARATELLCPKR